MLDRTEELRQIVRQRIEERREGEKILASAVEKIVGKEELERIRREIEAANRAWDAEMRRLDASFAELYPEYAHLIE